jgi:hypothetical protein
MDPRVVVDWSVSSLRSNGRAPGKDAVSKAVSESTGGSDAGIAASKTSSGASVSPTVSASSFAENWLSRIDSNGRELLPPETAEGAAGSSGDDTAGIGLIAIDKNKNLSDYCFMLIVSSSN